MRTAPRVLGECAIAAGLVLLLFCAYLVWGTGSYTERRQESLRQQLEQKAPPKAQKGPKGPGRIKLGDALALLRIPRFGDDYKYAIVEGVDAAKLRQGPGHYPGTAMPGEIGNFVLSGHRTTYSAPFNRIDELRRGDDIVVDARDARYTYRVTRAEVVEPTRMEVIAPVPEHPGERPARPMITLTTCHPEYSARQRLIVYGVLAQREERTTGSTNV